MVPTGYTFNLDGTCIYLTMAAVFLAQATDTPLTLIHLMQELFGQRIEAWRVARDNDRTLVELVRETLRLTGAHDWRRRLGRKGKNCEG